MSSHPVCAGGTPVSAPGTRRAAPTVADALATKRDGGTLTAAQVRAFVDAVASGAASDAQVGAMCMAVFTRGMNSRELSALCGAMARSGETLTWERPTVDKHSTGGVGDKTSLVVAPLLAAAGFDVPMLSGRSLGHTGGTLDKLESVEGFRCDLSPTELREVVHAAGAAVAAASPRVAPADRVMYRVRDETATVASIPLVASSIVSKKLAAGAGALVLDVKCGSAAFFPELGQARELARTMVQLCTDSGVPATALLSRMDLMCGTAAGNAAEVHEALEVLAGGGDRALRELCLDLALSAAHLSDPSVSCEELGRLLDQGHALERFERMLVAQGARWPLCVASPSHTAVLRSPRRGTVWFDALGVARTAAALGACRAVPGDDVDPSCGVWRLVPELSEVSTGDELLRLECSDPGRLEAAVGAARAALRWADEELPEFDGRPVVLERVEQETP